jgi:hypothetical protein
MTRAELIGLVENLMNRCFASEDELNAAIRELRANVSDPNVTDLIFYSEPEMSAEEIVEAALAYRPIELPDH